ASKRSAPSPAPTTVPTIWCPCTSGSFGRSRSPSTMCRSVRQTPQVETEIRTWPGLTAGSASSAGRSGSRCLSRTIARIGLDDLVQRRPLRRLAPGGTRGRNQLLGLKADAVLRARHARDALLHQRAAQVIDPPAQRLGGGVEAHLHPARLQVGNRLAEREAKSGGVLEVLRRRDLLDPVRAAEHRVEGDEAERHELGDAAGALLQGADDAHVAGQLAR